MFSPEFTAEGHHSVGEHQGFQGYEDCWTCNNSHLFMEEDIGGMDYLWSSYGVDGGITDHPSFLESAAVDGVGFDEVPPGVQLPDRPLSTVKTDQEKSFVSEISEIPEQNKSCTVPSSSFELLSNYRMSYNHFNGEKISNVINKERDPIEGGRELSTEEVMRVAAARFIQLSMRTEGDPSLLMHHLGVSFSGLMAEEKKNVDLASLLLAAAEKVSIQQYDPARNLLSHCYKSSSSTGNPIQRVVYYFSEALHERIDRETRSLSSKRPRERGIPAQELIKEIRANHPMKLVTHQKLPFSQIVQFTTMQTIIDNVASANRIHMIDLSIKHGLQWTIFMQALSTRSNCPIEYLKISAIGTSGDAINTAGKSLVSFAETLSLPFHFKPVIVSDMKDLKEDMFEVVEGEVIGVYSSLDMNILMAKPNCLDNVMRVIRRLRPCIMTVTDFEAKYNSPSFINRFTEALFDHSAFFDCLDAAMDRDDINRMIVEAFFCSEGIKNIVAAKDSERVVRRVGVAVWRLFFARFGLVEAELNEWSQYQGSLLTQKFAHGSSFNLTYNGKSLMVGWKGTPLIFISAWKFP